MNGTHAPRHDASAQDGRRRRWRLPWPVGGILAGLGVALLLRFFVIGVFYVPSGSMLSTIHEGDLILGEMVTLNFDGPSAGDVVTFEIDLVDGLVYVDGAALDEPYTEGRPTESLSEYPGSAGISYPYTVPEGTIWVMGDNRTNSKDSRFFGPVSVDDVTSKVLFIYWPLSHVGAL